MGRIEVFCRDTAKHGEVHVLMSNVPGSDCFECPICGIRVHVGGNVDLLAAKREEVKRAQESGALSGYLTTAVPEEWLRDSGMASDSLVDKGEPAAPREISERTGPNREPGLFSGSTLAEPKNHADPNSDSRDQDIQENSK